MGLILKDFTGKDIYDAIIKDGFHIIREDFLQGEGENLAACLLGTAGLNLGVLSTTDVPNKPVNPQTFDYTLLTQLNSVYLTRPSVWADDDTVVRVGLADEIIRRFDETISIPIDEPTPDEDWGAYDAQVDRFYFELPDQTQVPSEDSEHYGNSYYRLSLEESYEMVKELLTPFFSHVFTLAVYDYSEHFKWTPPEI